MPKPKWFHRIGIAIVRSDSVPAPKNHVPTFLDTFTAPLQRKTFTRHPDDPGCWEYMDLTDDIRAQHDREQQADWLNTPDPRVWHRIITSWRPRRR